MTQTLVLGGPGCGKTTKLLDILEGVLKQGFAPDEIAFLAFTRKAAHEARERAAKRFGFTEDELPYFKTLHALAFAQMALTTSEVMGKLDYATIGKALGWNIGEADEDSGVHAVADAAGDKVAFVEQMARLSGQTLEWAVGQQTEVRIWDALLYRDTLSSYKRSRHTYDFTDMLSVFLDRGPYPNLRVVFIDEAQDLSPLQWRLVNRLIAGAEQVYFGGDDDQAIYEWSGADVKQFMSLTGNRIVLPRSHRLPSVVFNKATHILDRISQRFPKEWIYDREGGTVDFYSSVDYLSPTKDETWFYLARNRYMLSGFTRFLREQGIPYNLLGRSSIDNDTVRAILCWEGLRKGTAQPPRHLENMVSYLRPGNAVTWKRDSSDDQVRTFEQLTGLDIPITEDWMTAIRMTDTDLEYYRSILRAGESLIKPPHVTVSTIHQVKGGEADHVVLGTDMSYSCYTSLQSNPDSEHRVFYVGATRAKKSLHVLYPTTSKFYEV